MIISRALPRRMKPGSEYSARTPGSDLDGKVKTGKQQF